MPVEILNHTADIRIRVVERDKNLLYLRLGNAMLNLIFDESTFNCDFFNTIEIEKTDAINFLNYLIYETEKNRTIFKLRCISIKNDRIIFTICGEKFDENKHSYHYLIKAATYHKFIETENSAEVTFDI